MNELFDYLQQMYVKQSITIADYFAIYRDLHTIGVINAKDVGAQQLIES